MPLSNNTVFQLIAYISEHLEEQLIEKMTKKQFSVQFDEATEPFSVQFDEATDCNGTGHMIAYA
jgi:hypothetical protein